MEGEWFAGFIWLTLKIVASFLALLVALVAAFVHHRHRQCDHIPGPHRSSFWFGNLGFLKNEYKKGKFLQQIILECFQKYGHTFRLSLLHRHVVATTDPEAIQELLVNGGHPKGEIAYKNTQNLFGRRFFGGGLVTELDEQLWEQHRGIMNPAFNRKYLKGLMDSFNDVTDQLINKLCMGANGKTPVSLHNAFSMVALDTIGKVAFGMDINSINESTPFVKAITTALDGFTKSVQNPLIAINPFKKAFRADVRKAIDLLRDTGRTVINERLAAMKAGDYVPDDILTYITHMAEAKVPTETLIDHFTTFFVAGQDTTANMISFLVQEAGRNPGVLKRLQAEVDAVLGERRYVTFDDIGKLEYMSQTIKETLRLYPPVSVTFRDLAKDITIGEYAVPSGTMIMLSIYATQRINGDLDFDPDRFSKVGTKPNVYSYFPFSLGARSCIGQTFAKMEAKVILAKFFQRLNFNLDPTQSFEIQETSFLRPKGGVMCTLSLRDEAN